MRLLIYTALCGLIQRAVGTWTPIAALSWAPSQISVFFNANGILRRKYYTSRSGWQPFEGRFERLSSKIGWLSRPTAVSWGENRGDVFLYDDNGRTLHKYWDGTTWHPQGLEQLASSSENRTFGGRLSAASSGKDRLDVVDMIVNNSHTYVGDYVHLYWDGHEWNGWKDWSEKGVAFSSPPSIVSWGPDRFDVFGVDANQTVRHKYWDGKKYNDGWELLDRSTCDGEENNCDPPDGFKSDSVTASSWGPGRWDVWAVGNDAQLWHTYWDGSSIKPCEPLGGSFEAASQVLHWSQDRIDIVVFGGTEGDPYLYKYGYWDGSHWHWKPSAEDWIKKDIDGGFDRGRTTVKIPLSLRVQINVFAGALYFSSFDEYVETCKFLGVVSFPAKTGWGSRYRRFHSGRWSTSQWQQ
ncbi:hypothetical protein M409DRAFT_52531 [Zasmidium cellare ATCC 36951]|uniref:Fucose-specific lectin n=1 Tax=Zasmidium cellare ATCC 36951 TaxID=1080233 RepID=A0A6A6CSV2_ZASCE|nr:uncharacterized protein M409DRAFT_52531 [Zasmidium cellare ATCC 36951]KAF2169268.1 hypothetical protein M409DRAFT_52531 [Zasmidium cellare ATCC 36951]